MYQYATAFLGMKMHEDEYKLLGYEVRVKPTHVEKLTNLAHQHVEGWFTRVGVPHLGSMYDPIFNLAALDAVREHYFTRFSNILTALGLTDPNAPEARAAIAYYVQHVLETCVMAVLDGYDVDNLIVSGGCFYNVKLNKVLVEYLPAGGKFCAYPLAGDQGNALGLYFMDFPSFEFPADLFWGHRKLEDVGEVAGLEYISQANVTDRVLELLHQYGYVNLVRGSMEFGPRALCHTSTLARPWGEVVDVINIANNRNTVMPMAPVVTRNQYRKLFKHTDKVWKSEKYMITALEYQCQPPNILGAAHEYRYPWEHHYTGRPQVCDMGDPMIDILTEIGLLINTSFNYHGKPIAFDMPSVIENHQLQHARNPTFTTLVVID